MRRNQCNVKEIKFVMKTPVDAAALRSRCAAWCASGVLGINYQKMFHSICRIALHTRKDVNIDFQCNTHVRVSKTLAHDLKVLTVLQEKSRARVSQVVVSYCSG